MLVLDIDAAYLLGVLINSFKHCVHVIIEHIHITKPVKISIYLNTEFCFLLCLNQLYPLRGSPQQENDHRLSRSVPCL